MKNLASFIFLLLLCSNVQLFSQYKIEIGAEGSINRSSLRGNDFLALYHEPAIAYSGGLTFQYNFSKLIALRTGIAFERKSSVVPKGSYFDPTVIGTSYSERFNFDYLTLPVLLRATFGRKVRFFTNAGPFLAYLLKQNSVIDDPDIIASNRETDNTKYYNRYDFGISFGAGAQFPLRERFALSLEIRNNLGLVDISEVPVVKNGTIKTNSTQLLLGIVYKLKPR